MYLNDILCRFCKRVVVSQSLPKGTHVTSNNSPYLSSGSKKSFCNLSIMSVFCIVYRSDWTCAGPEHVCNISRGILRKPERAPELIPGFLYGSCFSICDVSFFFWSLLLYVFLGLMASDYPLSQSLVCRFSFRHCILCPSSIDDLWLAPFLFPTIDQYIFTRLNEW